MVINAWDRYGSQKATMILNKIADYKFVCWSLLYSATLRSRADSLHSNAILHE